MSKKVIFQAVNDYCEFGPAIYGYKSASRINQICDSLAERMEGHCDDHRRVSARLVQELCGDTTGWANFKIWNTARVLKPENCPDSVLVQIRCHSDGTMEVRKGT